MTTSTPPVFYTVRQVADMLQLKSTNKIERAVAAEEVPHVRWGRTIRFTDAHVRDIARMFEQKAAAKNAGPSRRQSDVDLTGVPVSARSRRRHSTPPS